MPTIRGYRASHRTRSFRALLLACWCAIGRCRTHGRCLVHNVLRLVVCLPRRGLSAPHSSCLTRFLAAVSRLGGLVIPNHSRSFMIKAWQFGRSSLIVWPISRSFRLFFLQGLTRRLWEPSTLPEKRPPVRTLSTALMRQLRIAREAPGLIELGEMLRVRSVPPGSALPPDMDNGERLSLLPDGL